ncbi:MAG: class I SAM-dependent methyltransferase [Candidatus Micrarchaeota archaeon]
MNTKDELEKLASVHYDKESLYPDLMRYGSQAIIELSKGPKILEVGCGDGLMTKELAKHFNEIVAIDGSETRLERTKKIVDAEHIKNLTIKFHCTLFEDFTINDKFDTVIATHVLEHVDDPARILEKIKEWLAPKGIVIISVPNATSIHRQIGKKLGLIKDLHELGANDFALGHQRYYDLATLKNEIEQSGLKIERTRGIFVKPFHNAQMEKLDPQMIKAFYDISKDMPPEICAEVCVACTI